MPASIAPSTRCGVARSITCPSRSRRPRSGRSSSDSSGCGRLQSQIADLQEQIGGRSARVLARKQGPSGSHGSGAGAPGRAHRRRGFDQGREWDRQGGVRAGDSCLEPARRAPVCHRELPEPECRLAGKRALRPRPRLVHRRGRRHPGEGRRGRGRARCSSTRSATSRCCSSRNCCGSFRNGATSASARTARAAPTSG